jgi:hypothetical protein
MFRQGSALIRRRCPRSLLLAFLCTAVAAAALAADGGAAVVQPAAKPKNSTQAGKPIVPPVAAVFPPMAYEFVGRVAEGNGASSAVLSKNGITVIAAAGTVLDDVYRVDAVQVEALEVTHLPSGIKRVVPFKDLNGQVTAAAASSPRGQASGPAAGVTPTARPHAGMQVQTIVADEKFDPATFTTPPGVIVNILPPPGR